MSNNVHEITLTHVNIRQSISILVAKLIFLDFLAAVLVISSYFIIVTGGSWINFNQANSFLFLSIFVITGIVKIAIDTWAILLWLNEYFEITPEFIEHKKGVLFKKTEQYRVDHIRAMTVENTFFGELFNFATITLFDIRLNKYLDMNFVHNAQRYANIIKRLRPHIETKEDYIKMLKHDEDNDEREIDK